MFVVFELIATGERVKQKNFRRKEKMETVGVAGSRGKEVM